MSPDQLAEAHSAIFGGVGKTLENDPSVVLKEAPAPADEALRVAFGGDFGCGDEKFRHSAISLYT